MKDTILAEVSHLFWKDLYKLAIILFWLLILRSIYAKSGRFLNLFCNSHFINIHIFIISRCSQPYLHFYKNGHSRRLINNNLSSASTGKINDCSGELCSPYFINCVAIYETGRQGCRPLRQYRKRLCFNRRG